MKVLEQNYTFAIIIILDAIIKIINISTSAIFANKTTLLNFEIKILLLIQAEIQTIYL